jgi:predicted  nucleic acid-binding Zn-ribbon protein
MSDISILEGRITAALDRIRRGVEWMDELAASAPALPMDAPDQEVAALRTRLDEEQTVNAQLEERVRALKDRQDGRLAHLETEVAENRARLAAMDDDMQRLRQTNAELRDMAAQLREALAEGVTEPQLINRAMLAELEALRAARAVDLAEVNAVMAELRPFIGEAH